MGIGQKPLLMQNRKQNEQPSVLNGTGGFLLGEKILSIDTAPY